MIDENIQVGEAESVQRLSRDLAKAARTMSHAEARFMVDSYYQMQEDRIRAMNQMRATIPEDSDSADEEAEPHEVLLWLTQNSSLLEKQVARALDKYTEAHEVGKWARSIVGIGPILAAGLLAHISMNPHTCARVYEPGEDEVDCSKKKPCTPKCGPQPLNTVGQIWRFAGLDPTSIWEKGKKRPHNAKLKTLCWKIGESFVKQSGNDSDVYGHLYVQRKAYETAKNLAGDYEPRAVEALERKRFGDDTDAKVWLEGRLSVDAARKFYETPSERRMGLSKKLAGAPGSGVRMLPPGHIHARSKRWAVKLFLAHWHAVAFRAHFKRAAPKPYVIAILGHADEIRCPNWPFDEPQY
jgi:hypothetical protein